MDHHALLQHAIQLARKGERARARDFLIEIVEADAGHVTAWAWLIDLLDDPEDRIYACEQVLAADPENGKLRAKYRNLLSLRTAQQAPPPGSVPPPAPPPALLPPTDPLVQAKQFIALGQREEARKILLPLVKRDKRNEQAWLLVSEAVEDEGKQIAALTNALRVNPANEDAQLRLKNLKHFRDNPLDLASLYEEEGKFDEAIAALHRAALTFNYGPEFDRIYANIERLERRKTSGVVHIRPTHSIARLTFGPPVLFFLLMLVHNQMNPFAFTPLLWLGVLMTLGGGFLLALANVRSRHPLWVKLFDDPSASSSPLARLTVSLAGWLLLFIAFAYLLQSSFNRLPLLTTNTFLHP